MYEVNGTMVDVSKMFGLEKFLVNFKFYSCQLDNFTSNGIYRDQEILQRLKIKILVLQTLYELNFKISLNFKTSKYAYRKTIILYNKISDFCKGNQGKLRNIQLVSLRDRQGIE